MGCCLVVEDGGVVREVVWVERAPLQVDSLFEVLGLSAGTGSRLASSLESTRGSIQATTPGRFQLGLGLGLRIRPVMGPSAREVCTGFEWAELRQQSSRGFGIP